MVTAMARTSVSVRDYVFPSIHPHPVEAAVEAAAAAAAAAGEAAAARAELVPTMLVLHILYQGLEVEIEHCTQASYR
jgi:hypothetical protein